MRSPGACVIISGSTPSACRSQRCSKAAPGSPDGRWRPSAGRVAAHRLPSSVMARYFERQCSKASVLKKGSASMSLPPSIHVSTHPLVQHKLSKMRDKLTSSTNFRRLLREMGLLLGYDATRDLPLVTGRIETPLAPMDAPLLEGKKLVVVPILRAGLGLAEGIIDLVPLARMGHIGIYRDPGTLQAVE